MYKKAHVSIPAEQQSKTGKGHEATEAWGNATIIFFIPTQCVETSMDKPDIFN